MTTPNAPPKKKRKPTAKGKVSFGLDEEEGDQSFEVDSSTATPRSATPDILPSRTASPNAETVEKRRLGPNANVTFVPKAMTKSALLREAQTKEQLRKEFLVMQEAVKDTEIIIPFVFYDGTNIPGGACKVKKGDYIWLFLDRSRKVGAQLGISGGEKNSSRREWARVGVDDLMLVRGEIIIPHVSSLGMIFTSDKGLIGWNSTTIFTTSSSTGPLALPLHHYSIIRQPQPSHCSNPMPLLHHDRHPRNSLITIPLHVRRIRGTMGLCGPQMETSRAPTMILTSQKS